MKKPSRLTWLLAVLALGLVACVAKHCQFGGSWRGGYEVSVEMGGRRATFWAVPPTMRAGVRHSMEYDPAWLALDGRPGTLVPGGAEDAKP